MLDDDRMLDALATGVDGLDAIDGGPLDAAVAACPGWTVLDLLGHVGRVHRRTYGMLVDGDEFRWLAEAPPPPPADEVVAWRRETSRSMLDAFRRTDPDRPMDTFIGPRDARTWLRRMVHETAIHRWDAEVAVDAMRRPLDDDVAVDAIDEWFDVFVSGVAPSTWAEVAPVGASIHIHAHLLGDDPPGEWLARIDQGELAVVRASGRGDVAVRGPASDLALVLTNRQPPSAVDVVGDGALLGRFLAATAF